MVPLVVFLSNSKQTRDHNAFDRVIVWLSSPIQWVVVGTLDSVSDAWSRYVALGDVEEENRALRDQIAELSEELSRRQEQALENQRLRLLLDLRERSPGVTPITARIIATSPTPTFRSVRIDRGEDDGVHVGAAVVNHDGAVGRVAAVAGAWSDVMLLVDANSSTEVLVQRTRARARVRGLGGDEEIGVRVEYLTRTDEVAPGDVLITSGVGSVFPKGLRVGTITAVERGAFGLYQSATVEPSVDFHRLEEVLVLPRGWPRDTTYEEGLGVEVGPGGAVSTAGGEVAPAPSPAPSTGESG